MIINLSRTHYPVTALGPGQRVGIWTQGCALACPGCVSRDTWDRDGGTARDVDEIIHWIGALGASLGVLDGVTISGGEPSEQPEALRALVSGISELRAEGGFDGDVLCYTGFDLDEFLDRCPWAPDELDAVITGRYHAHLPTELVWRGSDNQRLVPLSDRGRRTYAPHIHRTATDPQMQFAVAGGAVWMIGIPRRGDLRRLEQSLRSDGVTLEKVSWRQR